MLSSYFQLGIITYKKNCYNHILSNYKDKIICLLQQKHDNIAKKSVHKVKVKERTIKISSKPLSITYGNTNANEKKKKISFDVIVPFKLNRTTSYESQEKKSFHFSAQKFTLEKHEERTSHIAVKSSKRYIKPNWLKICSNVLYITFAVIIFMIMLGFFALGGTKSLFGFHLSCALSDKAPLDMRPGSLIISKITPTQNLVHGDVITYVSSEGENETAAISHIIVNHEKTGRQAFRMQEAGGTIKPELVKSEEVLGETVFCLPVFGTVINFIMNNLWIVAVVFAFLIAAVVLRNKKFKRKMKPVENEKNKKPMPTKKKKAFRFISNILFYGGLVVLIIAVIAYSGNGSVKTFFGYSYMGVLTRSMQSEIPQNSIVLIKYTEPDSIHTGDNITYLTENGMTITHKVIQIFENYENSGAKGFQTKGVDNNIPDKDVVLAANVVGVVQTHIPYIGKVLMFIASNVWFVVILFVLFMGLSFTLRMYVTERKKKR